MQGSKGKNTTHPNRPSVPHNTMSVGVPFSCFPVTFFSPLVTYAYSSFPFCILLSLFSSPYTPVPLFPSVFPLRMLSLFPLFRPFATCLHIFENTITSPCFADRHLIRKTIMGRLLKKRKINRYNSVLLLIQSVGNCNGSILTKEHVANVNTTALNIRHLFCP